VAFAYQTFYPSGGYNDFIGTFNTDELARAAIDQHHRDQKNDEPYSEGHVVDLLTSQKLWVLSPSDGWMTGAEWEGEPTPIQKGRTSPET
jgi:hypothetical protein